MKRVIEQLIIFMRTIKGMRTLTSFCFTIILSFSFTEYGGRCFGQNVSISEDGATPDNTSILDISSTNRGFLLPRMTETERDAISSPATSLMIFNTTSNCLQIYISSQWMNISCACDPPVAPLATAATNTIAIAFDANWNAVSGATAYYIDVDDNADFSSPLTGYNNLNVGNVVTYSITGLTAGTTYYYRVRAENSCGIGGNSNTITTITPTCPILSDNFSVDNWGNTIGTEVAVDATTDLRLEFRDQTDGDFDGEFYDLQNVLGAGVNADDAAWILRFKLEYTSYTTRISGSARVIFGLMDQAADWETNMDAIIFWIDLSTADDYILRSTNNSDPRNAPDDGKPPGEPGAVGVPRYIELKRNSATSYSAEVFSDASYTTSLGSASGTCSSATTNLRYITVQTSNGTDAQADLGGFVDDLEFCNGVTSW